MLQSLQGKQKYQVTNVGIEKIKLCVLAQRINEFTLYKMNEFQRKTPLTVKFKTILTNGNNIVSYFWALN